MADAPDGHARQKPLKLTDEQRDQIVAVVLDCNSMGGGNLHLDRLGEWADRCRANGLELWVPEVVLEEWAEHAAEAFEKASTAAGKERAELRKVGLEPSWTVADREAVISHVVEEVRALENVIVLDLDPDDAREAMRDQVLQRGSGSRKQQIKTGAVDSALLRTVHRRTHGKLETVVLVTGDRGAVDKMCDLMDWPPLHVVDGLHLLAESLELLDTTDTHARWVLASALSRALPVSWAQPGYVVDLDSFTVEGATDAAYRDVPTELREFIQGASLTSVDRLAGITDVLADQALGRFLAEAYLLCTVTVHTAGYDNDGGTVHEEHEAGNLLLRCRIQADVADGELTAFDPGLEDTRVVARDERAHTSMSALHYARAALDIVPGLGDGEFPSIEGGIRAVEVNGQKVVLNADVDDERWQLSASIGDDTVAVLRCRPHRRVYSAGDSVVFEVEPTSFAEANPPWEFAADVLERLL